MTKLNMVQAPIGRLRPNPWNTNRITDPENEARLRESMSRFGVFKPIIVRELQDGVLEILGGEHRWKMAQEMGMTEVPIVNLGPIDDRRAKEIGLVDNGRYGQDDFAELGKLVAELGKDIFTIVPFNEADFRALDKIASQIDLDDLDSLGDKPAMDAPELPKSPTSQLMRFKVPIGDTPWLRQLIEQEMKRGGFTQEDDLSNAGHALVSLLQRVAKG